MAELAVTVTCPICAHRSQDVMPVDRCVIWYQCGDCQAILKPKAGDCCVYCSYGDKRCPPVQDSTECPGCDDGGAPQV